MKHVVEHRLHACDSLYCRTCRDELRLEWLDGNEPPLWMQLAIKDAFVSMHSGCTVSQRAPTKEKLIYERTDRRPRAPLPHLSAWETSLWAT